MLMESLSSPKVFREKYRDSAWFRALKAQQFTTAMPFSAPENTAATGTYIEDLHIDSDVKAAYPGDDGLTLGFSAPVYRDGKVVAYWTNRASFRSWKTFCEPLKKACTKRAFPTLP